MNAEKPSDIFLTKHIVSSFRGNQKSNKEAGGEGIAIVKMASKFSFHL